MITMKKIETLIKGLKKALDLLDAAQKLHKMIKKTSPESKPLEEGNIQTTQGYEQKIDMCINSLRQHVKVINRNSNALKEHSKIIEDITAQSEDLAIALNTISRWVTILIWTNGLSFVIAIIAVVIAIFK
jgi:predicted ribosome quality control (RQC) complex YloA/Tae2 family protein